MTLPSQVDQPDPQIELAFDPDLAIHPEGWEWTDATGDRLAQEIAIKKGRSDETGIVEPSGTTFQLDNRSGAWTPADARSPHWPHLKRNTPVRITLPGGTSRLTVDGGPGNDVSTPDAAATSITGDIDLRAEADITWYDHPLTSGVQELVKKWGSAGSRSYRLVQLFRQINLAWSPDGTNQVTFSAPAPVMGHGAVRATLDVDNGAGGWTGRLYWAPTLDGPWTLWHEATDTGTTSIFDSTADLIVGATTIGSVYRAEVYADLAGADRRAAPDFTGLPTGSDAFVDDEGLTWTFGGTATVTDADVRCFGQIGEITPTWPHGDISDPDDPETNPGEARVDITIAGILRRLSQGAKALRSTLYRSITSPANTAFVFAYWPLEEGRDAVAAASPIPGVLPGTMGVPFASDDTLASSDSLPSQSGGQPCGWNLSIPSTVPTTAWEVTWFFRIPTPATSPAFTDLMRVDATSGTISQWVLRIDDTNVSLFAKDLDGVNISPTNPVTIPSDARMFDTWVVATLAIVQNGSDVDYAFTLIPIPLGAIFTLSGTLTSRTCGRPTGLPNLISAAPPDGISVGHFIVTSGLTTGWLAGADTAWVDETAAHRVWRLCLEENIPVEIIGDELVALSFRGDPAESEPMGPQGLKTLLDLLSECAATDMGILFERDGRPGIGYRTRRSLYNQTPALALDAATSDITNPFEPTLDDQSLRNDITARRDIGSFHRETTDPPPQPGDVYEETVTVNVATDDQLPGQAGWRLHLGAWPEMRYRSVSSELTVAPHQMEPWRAVRLGDRVTISNLPPQHPAPTVDLLIQGWTETLSPTRWTIEANCTPAGPWDVGALDEDTPTVTLQRFRTDGSTLAGSLTETQTGAVSVDVTGPLWTTDSAYFPMQVLIAGEEVTLSAISGASTPQTFTISARAVNGVEKAHSAGADVDVADPFRLAM